MQIDKKVDPFASAPPYPDAPPSYNFTGGPSAHDENVKTPEQLPAALISVDQISITRRSKDIEGRYQIRPRPNQLQSGNKRKRFWGSGKTPNAYFGTRNGLVNLELSTGTTSDLPDTVDVQVGSRAGNITIKLTTLTNKTAMNMQVGTRRGHITLYIPQDYYGSIQLSTRQGTLNLLPGASELARLEKAEAKKQILRFGAAGDTSSPSYCELYARNACVTVGLLGVDQFMPPLGFWEKLSGKFGIGGSKDGGNELDLNDESDDSDAGFIPFPSKE